MGAHEDVDGADGALADDDAEDAFFQIHLERAADVANQIRGRQREETPRDHDGQFAPAKQRAQPRHLPGISALEEPVEPHGFREVIDRR